MIIENEQLQVELIEMPSTNLRFDHVGVVKQVRSKKDNYEFLTKEKPNSNSINLGVGICNEFGPSRPIGFSNIDLEDWFLKPGVGKLQKSSTKYSFKENCLYVPEEITRNVHHLGVNYQAVSRVGAGFGYTREKSVILSNDEIVITQQLTNIGRKSFEIEEYFHNFLNFQKSILKSKDLEIDDHFLNIEKWSYNQEQQLFFAEWEKRPPIFSYSITDRNTGHHFTESGDFSPYKFKIWSQDYCICPECFILISLKSGESKQWQRRFKFV